MNFSPQGLQSTCPQGIARRALEALVRVLVQAGQWSLGFSVSVVLVVGFVSEVEKLIVMRVFRLRGWVEVGEEPGQRGWSFVGVGEGFWVVVEVDGVRAGTQKEGRVALEDCGARLLVLILMDKGDWGIWWERAYLLLIDGLSSLRSFILVVL